MVNVQDKASRRKRKLHHDFSCFYLTSSPTTHLMTMTDRAGRKQEAKKHQSEATWISRLHPRSRKEEARGSAAEDKGRDRLQDKNFHQ